MYLLTRNKDDFDSGVYATKDDEGTTMIQLFVDKDDALMYNEQLTAVGYDLEVSEAPDDSVDKMCEALGYAYSIAEPGDLVVPRMETLQAVIGSMFE